jgi:DNA-binding Xre family transcriptional regulator
MELNRDKITFEMNRLGWTQAELAKQMKIHRQQLNVILNDPDVGVNLKTIQKFADALKINPHDLLI